MGRRNLSHWSAYMHQVQMLAWLRITEVLQPDNFTHYFFTLFLSSSLLSDP